MFELTLSGLHESLVPPRLVLCSQEPFKSKVTSWRLFFLFSFLGCHYYVQIPASVKWVIKTTHKLINASHLNIGWNLDTKREIIIANELRVPKDGGQNHIYKS